MELSLLVLEKIAGLLLMALCGVVLVNTGAIRQQDHDTLSKLCAYIFTPGILLSAFLREWTREEKEAVLIAFLVSVVIHLFFLLLNTVFQHLTPLSAVDKGTLAFTNAGAVIIPLVIGTIGKEYIVFSGAYMVAQNMLVWTYGVITIGRQKIQLKRVFTTPAILAIIAGALLMLLDVRVPQGLADVISDLGACMAPVSLILIGIVCAGTGLEQFRSMPGLVKVTVMRLLLYPLLSLPILMLLSRVIHHSQSWQILFVMMLCSAGPGAVLVPQVAQIYRNEQERASYLNVITTVCCAVTMPLITLIAQMVLL